MCHGGVLRCIVLLVASSLGVGLSAQVSTRQAPSPRAQTPLKSAAAQTVRALTTSGRLDTLRWPVFSDYRTLVNNFYRPAGYELAWVRGGVATPAARKAIEVLGNADNEGLHAEDYDASLWAARLAGLQQSHTPDDEARFDVALTVCVMRYISDRRIGRINPQHLKFELDVSSRKLDLVVVVRKYLAEGDNPEPQLEKLDPPTPAYRRAHAALLHYMKLAKQQSGHKLPTPAMTIYPGGPYNDISGLASFLRLVGDLPESVTIPPDSTTYDTTLAEAVKRFQKRHGLPVNGFLDSTTIEQLNVPLSERVEHIRLVLERFRWLHYNYSQPPIVVNVPEFLLYAFDHDGQVGLTMNVNVGDAFDFQTPIFENAIRYLVFRPYWNVPPSIQRNEIVPAIEEDRDYIQDNRMEVITPGGQVVTSGTISNAVLQQLRSGKLLVRERPNPENALGLLKIIFPNKHNVYLHDTPEGVDMFSGERALSHGCIHLQEPAKMAAWLLRDQGWDLDAVEKAMKSGRDNHTVTLKKPVPIAILYGTVVVKEDGTVYFYQDIYGHDAALEKALAKGYPYPG